MPDLSLVSTRLSSLYHTTRLFVLSSLRSPEALFFGFAFPLIFIAIFSAIGQNPSSYTVGVSSASLKDGIVYQTLNSSDLIKLNTTDSDDVLNEQLQKGQLPAIITITDQSNSANTANLSNPANTSTSTEQNNQINQTTPRSQAQPQYRVVLQLSEASPQNARIVNTIIDKILTSLDQQANPNNTYTTQLITQQVSGRAYKQVDFILPGQLSFALMSTAVFGISISLIILRKTHVLKRMAATPSPRWLILSAKVISNSSIALLQSAFIIGIGYFVFDFTLIHGWVTFVQMLAVSVFGLLVFLSFGLLVSSVAQSEEAASPIANVITIPQFILSGAFFPIELLPSWLQNFAKLLPMTFLNDALRVLSFEGGSFDSVAPQLFGLLIWAILIYIPVIILFRWE